ncbi:hypothetical protein [Mesonia aestuariivivens]|uniref:DUF4890 domain-containing protein n=1 Tax=Mesonia aestuariivivens TaxID=2796128 RepID=A0ABS6W4B9_9FLAO|nr:hypothetical protein [Mesonia aestuariivivens]MBW2962685.1 hypothetical protein [Mesonia aestuariivivens]
MKKIITFFAITIGLLVSSANLSAQNSKMSTEEIRKEAQQKVVQLDKQLNLSQEQEKLVSRQYYSRILNYDEHLNGQEKDEKYRLNKEKFDTSFMMQMKKILDDKQFAKFKKLEEKK